MASSVAKRKPLSSLIPRLDDTCPQVMDEREVLAGLGDSNFAKKAEILDQLKAYARRNHGRLDFEDRRALFHVLRRTLSDSDSATRLQCMDFLSVIIPEFGPDLDDCMSEILPQLVCNFGNSKVTVKKSAIQTVHEYMNYTSDHSGAYTALIEYGLKNQDRRTATECLVALPLLLTPNLLSPHEDLFPLTKALAGRLEVSSNPEASPAVICLQRIRGVVGQSVFDEYLRNLSENQRATFVDAARNCTLSAGKGSDVSNLRKAKSAGHLPSNGVIDRGRSHDLQEGQNALDRGHTIAGTRAYVGNDLDYERTEYGFVPLSVLAKLQDQNNWRVRAQGIEELKSLMRQLTDPSSVLPHLGKLFGLLLDFLDDVNFKITVTSIHILGLLIAKLGPNVRPFLKPLGAALTNKLGDNKIVIRQENMKVLMQLMHILSPKAVLNVLTSSLQHRNSRVREETVNVVIAALLTFPSSDFDLPELTRAIAPALVDSKRRVRQAALEAFAVIAQAMGPGRLQPVVSAVDAIELTSGGDGVMAAIQARLARRQLPRMNEDGLVEYAIPMPSSGTIRGQSTSPRGADVEWVLAGTSGTGSADVGSARSTPGLNDSLNNAGPSPRRYFSAGKHRLPWEGDSLQVRHCKHNTLIYIYTDSVAERSGVVDWNRQ